MSRLTINSNIPSLNAQRSLGNATKKLSDSYTRLSSGLRINKASDDAAGLSISESLKTDAKLSNQALRNVNDGISMVSIISTALDSQKQILFRMSELATQSANNTNSQAQRKALQQEYMSLQLEFDRVASSAKFNGISLLRNPDPNNISLMVGVTGADSSLLSVAAANSHRFAGVHATRINWDGSNRITGADVSREFAYYNNVRNHFNGFSSIMPSDVRAHDLAIFKTNDTNGEEVTLSVFVTATTFHISGSTTLAGSLTQAPSLYVSANLASGDAIGATYAYPADGKTLNINGTFATTGSSLNYNLDLSDLSFVSKDPFGVSLNTFPPDAQTRPTAIGFTMVLDRESSLRALETVTNRLQDLTILQSNFATLESRLDISASRLQVDTENFVAANSRITDIDVAEESSRLAATQILQQSAASILAQANQQPRLVLALLGDL